jgi:hypothetical protein
MPWPGDFSSGDPCDGWQLHIVDDSDHDRHSFFFEARRGDEMRLIDWSTHQNYSGAHFAAMVRMGFPDRTAIGGVSALYPADVDMLFARFCANQRALAA